MHDVWVKRRQSILEVELDHEIVALSVEQGSCLAFNESAAEVWKLLKEPARKRDLLRRLLDLYQVEPSICEAGLEGLLTRLTDLGLIELETRSA